MAEASFGEIKDPGTKTPEAIFFDLFVTRPSVPVMVSREALEDLAAKRGVDVDKLAGGLVELASMFQSELAETARLKLRMQETVHIKAGDLIR